MKDLIDATAYLPTGISGKTSFSFTISFTISSIIRGGKGVASFNSGFKFESFVVGPTMGALK